MEYTKEEDFSETLQDLQRIAKETRIDLVRGIIWARDEKGMTFREIGAAMGMAHGWIYRLYKKGKLKGL
jgi:cyanate lyase